MKFQVKKLAGRGREVLSELIQVENRPELEDPLQNISPSNLFGKKTRRTSSLIKLASSASALADRYELLFSLIFKKWERSTLFSIFFTFFPRIWILTC